MAAKSLIRAAKNVKIYRVSRCSAAVTHPSSAFCPQSQCEHLSRQCLDLASALRDHSNKLEGTGAQQAVDEVER